MGTPILKVRGSDGKIHSIAAITGGGYTLPNATAESLGGIKVGKGLSIDENGVLSADNTASTPVGGTSPDGYELISSKTTEEAVNTVEWNGLSLRYVKLTAYFPIASSNADSVFISINGIRTGYLSPSFLSTSHKMLHSITIETRGEFHIVHWLSMRDMDSPQEYIKHYGIPGWWGNENITSIKIETQTASSKIPAGAKFYLEGIS